MLVEQLLAMTLIAVNLLALLAVLGAGSNAVVSGRQRTVATSLGRQVLERLQGSAYASVAMNLSSPGLSSDIRVTGTAPALVFESEPLVGGTSEPYQVTDTAAGTTYTVSTFITAITSSGQSFRRATVFIEWTPSLTGNFHSQRFSTFIYPLDYGSYPAGNGLAEVVGATVRVTGSLGGDVFEDATSSFPGARARTNASTLRTAQGTASSATAVLDLVTGPLASLLCSQAGTYSDSAQCPLESVNETADNDTGTNSPTYGGTTGAPFNAATVTTPGGVTWSLPTGSGGGHASVESCGGCGFGDSDGTVWADATSATSSATQAGFVDTDGNLKGRLWAVEAGWVATASVDHETSGGDRVNASAQLATPAVEVFSLDGAGAFDAAVKVGGLTAGAAAAAGTGTASPSVSASAVTVQLWDGALGGYRTVSVTPGTPADETATATGPHALVVYDASGTHTIELTSRVQSTPLTSTSTGSIPRTEANAQHPSLLLVTVTAVISGPHPGSLTITFDYGQVTTHSAWTVAP